MVKFSFEGKTYQYEPVNGGGDAFLRLPDGRVLQVLSHYEMVPPVPKSMVVFPGEVSAALNEYVINVTVEGIHPVPHPLPIGTKILSIGGEVDDGDGDEPDENKTSTNVVGTVTSHDEYHSQGHTYGVKFPSLTPGKSVCVFIDQGSSPSIDDPKHYRVLELGNDE